MLMNKEEKKTVHGESSEEHQKFRYCINVHPWAPILRPQPNKAFLGTRLYEEAI
jgi:hypothetical protein